MKAALVIGCSHYDSPAIADVEFANEDAEQIATLLRDRSGFAIENIYVLSSSQVDPSRKPTRNNVISALTLFRSENPPPRPIEQFVLFFSGHGFHSPHDDRDYLLPQDGVSTSLEHSSLSIETILSFVRGWSPLVTILYLDACRAITSTGRNFSHFDPIRADTAPYSGCVTFCSCSPGERSFESTKAKRGIFTLALSMGMSEDGKCSTVYELNDYLVREVPTLSTQNNVPVQRPYTRVEPLELRNSLIVSESTRASWQGMTGLGNERRGKRIERFSDAHTLPRKLMCGIDFGTSHSAVTIHDSSGNVLFVPSHEGSCLVPSVVAITESGDLLVGWSAVEYAHLRPERALFNVKRSLGTATHLNLSGRSYAPEVLVAAIVRSLVRNVEEWTGLPVDSVLASAPANFTIQQCDLLRRAFDLAGVNVFRIISEPNAATITIDPSLFERQTGMALVVDLGGGTLDVSLVDYGEGVFEILGTGGDTRLGGMDFDLALTEAIRQSVAKTFGRPLSALEDSELQREAERAKIGLSTRDETFILIRNIEIAGNLAPGEFAVSRAFFRSVTQELNKRIEECIDDAIGRSGLDPLVESWRGKLDAIVMAGQGGRVFTMQEILTRKFPDIPILTKYQDNAVAFGLGRYSGVLGGSSKAALLLDAVPTSIAIRCKEVKSLENPNDSAIVSMPPENNALIELLPRDTTIPTFRNIDMEVIGTSTNVDLYFVELLKSGQSIEENQLGIVSVPIGHESRQLLINVDVDANRTIVIYVREASGSGLARIQLNNFVDVKAAAGAVYGPHSDFAGAPPANRRQLTLRFSMDVAGGVLARYERAPEEIRPTESIWFKNVTELTKRLGSSITSLDRKRLVDGSPSSRVDISVFWNEDELNSFFFPKRLPSKRPR